MWKFEKHSKRENDIYIEGRASEWLHFPLFATQIFIPPIFMFAPWWIVILFLIILDFIWMRVSIKFASLKIADLFWNVNKFKWIVFVFFGYFYISKTMWVEAAFSLLWPFIAFVLGLIESRFVPQDSIARLKEKFEK